MSVALREIVLQEYALTTRGGALSSRKGYDERDMMDMWFTTRIAAAGFLQSQGKIALNSCTTHR